MDGELTAIGEKASVGDSTANLGVIDKTSNVKAL